MSRFLYFALALAYRLKERVISATSPDPTRVPLDVSGPPNLSLEVTNLCNANCVFCGYQYRERPVQFMSQKIFEEALQQFATSLSASCPPRRGDLELTPVVGDPLIDKELVTRIAYARSFPQIDDIHLTTNAILLTRQLFDDLVDAGLTRMTISMSGFDAEEYRRVYRNNNYKKVLKNLQAAAASDRFARIEVEIGLRTDSFLPWLRRDYWRFRALDFTLTRNLFFDSWSGRIRDYDLQHSMFLRPQISTKRIPCVMLYRGPMIYADGRLTACGCRDLEGTSELSLGNLEDTPLRAPWSNGSMAGLRRRFVDGDPPDVCRDCTHYSPVTRVDSLEKLVQLGREQTGRSGS